MSLFAATAPAQWRAAVDLDTLAAAWSLAPAEMAALVGVAPDTIDGWRRSEEAGWSEATAARVAELRRLHEYLWISVPYTDWGQWWRRRWREDSDLRGRSPLEAALADRDAAIRQLFLHLSALAQPGYL